MESMDLARYIGETNRFKSKHADIFFQGTFRDSLGAKVDNDKVDYSVILGQGRRKALVIKNQNAGKQKVTASFKGMSKDKKLKLWRPFKKERTIKNQTSLVLDDGQVAVIISE